MLMPRGRCFCGETEDLMFLGERIDGKEVHVCPICMDEFLADPSALVEIPEDDEFNLTTEEVVNRYRAEERLYAVYD